MIPGDRIDDALRRVLLAYAIQGHAALWCSGIVGCYYNIMGLPVHRLAQVLRQAGAL